MNAAMAYNGHWNNAVLASTSARMKRTAPPSRLPADGRSQVVNKLVLMSVDRQLAHGARAGQPLIMADRT